MVEFDTTFLTWVFVENAKHEIVDAKERVAYLLSELSARGDQIVIPTPALSEILIKMGKARQAVIDEFTKNPRWIIAPFDLRAAIELSTFSDTKLTRHDKKQGIAATKAKVKFDRQIVAIGKVLRVSCVYSDDGDVREIGRREGVTVQSVAEITLPPKDSGDFKLTSPEARK
jgi:hypothetical protein